MKVVLDTVIYVRAVINSKSRNGQILFRLAHRYTMLLSPTVALEIVGIFYRSEVQRRFGSDADPTMAMAWRSLGNAELVEPLERLDISRDPKDNKFFECAVAGNADYIVSEDRDILDVGEFRGIKTITAAEFIRILTTRDEST